MNSRVALKQYGQISAHGSVMDASPHRLIQMLMEAAIGRLVSARGYLEHGKLAEKGEQINLAISVINGLRSSLNLDNGGEVAANLDSLYDYMTRRLFEANLNKDVAIIDEVLEMMRGLKESWDQLPQQLDAAGPSAGGQA